jgi:hypothetical protein
VAGLVSHVAGDFGGWGLTEAGRAVDAERIAAELETAGTRTVVAAAYDGFLVLNPELLDLCTAWQTRSVDGVVTMNDHSDPGHDARVLDRSTDLDRRAAMTWIHPLAAENGESAEVVGGKAHGLVVLRRLGLPVPQGSSSAPGHAAPSSGTGGCPTASMSSWRRPSPSSKPPSGGRWRCRFGPAGASRCPA